MTIETYPSFRIPSFFKSKGPKQFRYKPWYYDANKEEREKRNRMIRDTNELTKPGTNEFQFKLAEKWRESRSGQAQRNKSNLRLLVIIALLVWISYFLLFQ